MHFSWFAILALEWVAVANAGAPWIRSNGTSTALSMAHPETTSSVLGPKPWEPINAAISYVDTTSIVSIFYEPTGSMTTLIVATGEPTAEDTPPRAGFRTSTATTSTATTITQSILHTQPSPSATSSELNAESDAESDAESNAESDAESNTESDVESVALYVAPSSLTWGCIGLTWLAYAYVIV